MEPDRLEAIRLAEALIDRGLSWLRENFPGIPFMVERDVVWTLQQHLNRIIREDRVPFRVFNDYPMFPGPRRSQCTDLAILDSSSTVLVALEFKYEPSHERPDVLKSKLPVVFWGDDGVAKDVKRIQDYVAAGKAALAISVFIDEGGYFAWREPHPGSQWLDWGGGVRVLYARAAKSSGALHGDQPTS
jgi:hypothetical protein